MNRSSHGIATLSVDSLVLALREYLQCREPQDVDKIICDLICAAPIGRQCVWATSCVPDFGPSMEDPSNGYRIIASNIQEEFAIAPGVLESVDFAQRVLASLLLSDLRTVQFAQLWTIFGVDPDFHFILIVQVKATQETAPVQLSEQSVQLLQGSHQMQETNETSAPQHAGAEILAVNEELVAEDHFPLLMPASNEAPASYASFESYLNSLPELHPSDISSAHYQDSGTLLQMILNWRSMANLLRVLQLDSVKGSWSSRNICFSLANTNVTMMTEDILHHFSWSWTSYNRKRMWFGWAERAATKTWKNAEIYFQDTSSGVKISKIERELFGQWRGIVYLFQPNGAVENKREPHKGSNNYDESQAVRLSQAAIGQLKTNLARFQYLI
ncbi:hypothetical protein NLJ89_g3050 [Agrocybe chaxingu]|uniref:Uncharacterized protein n=1 Tax=Agrocybe chaxingu TaxID=84603 RepID=A0A9W8KBL2_9AGAR|nr:hypothetical protein NLJ89_g3050 [Agrocybe chaxingu]